MFSGIIERQGELVGLRATASGRRLAVRAAGYWRDLSDGASVAVDGVCLTVVRTHDDIAEFDLVGETLARTTLGRAAVGRLVNLERSLRADRDYAVRDAPERGSRALDDAPACEASAGVDPEDPTRTSTLESCH